MPQQNWTYISGSGHRYNVGLYHGNPSGHVVVHCNNQVTLIDFNVNDTKAYSFFIEEELLELKINKEENQFQYDFIVSEKKEAPKQKERELQEEDYFKYGLAILGVIIFVIIIFSVLS
ncbi:MAG: hypothetical protein AAFO07_09025 [Bacteroidota bacterium]